MSIAVLATTVTGQSPASDSASNDAIVVENTHKMDPTWGVVLTLLGFALFFLFSGLWLFRNTVAKKIKTCWAKFKMRFEKAPEKVEN